MNWVTGKEEDVKRESFAFQHASVCKHKMTKNYLISSIIQNEFGDIIL